MMRALLDTHALLWALMEPDRLSSTAREVVADPGTELLASAASAWEIGTKVRLGKLPDADHVVQNYSVYTARLGATTLAITDRHALYAGTLRWDHRDPFDRMLAAQSILEDVPLITMDRALSVLPVIRTIW